MEGSSSSNNGSIAVAPTSSSEAEDGGGTPISILPPEMLQHIFQHLQLRDLLRCREVCHQWKDATTIPARKKCSILPTSAKYFDHIQSLAVMFKLTDCLRVDPENFPISSFHIELTRYFWKDYSYNKTSSPKPFFSLIRKFVTELSFTFKEVPAFTRLLKGLRFHGSYQKLKHLSLEICYDYVGANVGKEKDVDDTDDDDDDTGEVDDDTDVIRPLSSIIEKAPNLDNITLKIGSFVNQSQTIPRCIEELGIRPKLKLLTTLIIQCAFNKVDWSTLTTIGLKLKTFSIKFCISPVVTEILRTFLESQSTSLTSLEIIHNNTGNNEASVELPCLPHVTKLTISELYNHGYWSGPPIEPRKLKFPGFSFHKQLPSLKELDLNGAKNSILDLFAPPAATSLNSLEKLVIPKHLMDSRIIGFGVARLAELFPNIKNLHIDTAVPRTSHITAILENMRGIEEFSIMLEDQSADFAVTGLSSKYCREIKAPPSRSWPIGIAKLQQPTATTMESLENLKVLRILRENEDWTGAPELTEISGFVLKKMKSLKYLDFGVRKFPPVISKDLRDDLEKHGIQILTQSPRHKRTQSVLLPNDELNYMEDSSDDSGDSFDDFPYVSDSEQEDSGSASDFDFDVAEPDFQF